ncbi:DUF4214 domain-containing protein [Telluria mixta]|uniref:DUF4214 domain-containing protein n=1 Tax=Telluria mixta TaxID=34071 RepID=A0ABT2C078_9BURK|nr:DUF4214 domain-containing protein [Telluria mixta]MCS0630783.1 DUF4214 domain-containing protein [Telluria mixta]WEM98786.1 DUF4214 domain-containing protein [Telluria mixta]
MRTLIRAAASALLVVLLASCGGDQQPVQHTGAERTAAALGTPASVDAEYEYLVQQLYLGYFGRPADPAGLAYFTKAYRAAGAPTTIGGLFDAYGTNAAVRNLVDAFAASEESKQLYPVCVITCYDAEWVLALYQNLFSHYPDAAGDKFWVDALNLHGVTRANVLLSVLAGAQGTDADLATRKVRAAVQFTRTLDAAGQRALYDGHIANTIVRGLMHNVAGMADDAAVQANIDATIGRLADLAAGKFDEAVPGTRRILLLAAPERLADNGTRLAALAGALGNDLTALRRNGPAWSVDVAAAATTISAIRAQLEGYDGALLVGQVPIPTAGDAPFLDVYRLPDCPAFDLNAGGQVLNALALHSADPRCQNGLVLSVLRGTSPQAEAGELANKLDQMIAYHRAGASANAGWVQRFRMIEAGWFGGPAAQWGDQSDKWANVGLYPAGAISYLNEGTSVQRRDAFLDCIGQNTEMCVVNVHGAPQYLDFEGPGTPGVFYSSDSTDWNASSVAAQSVKAKYIELASCSTQNFLYPDSVGTTLLMRGNALLTRGTTTVTAVTSLYEDDIIKNEYALLQNGSTFAETVYGRLEGSPVSLQGDPWITMRPVPAGPQPKLVIDGKHQNGGALTMPITMADAVGGAGARRVVIFSNRGDADLHVRIGTIFVVTGVDYGTPQGGQYEYGENAQFETDSQQSFSDGRVLLWPNYPFEQMGGVMPVTLKPGQSVAITYRLSVRTGPDGKPKRPGLYTGQLTVTSDDPASARVYLAMQGRVR